MTLPHSHVNGIVIGNYDASSNDSTAKFPLYRAGMDLNWLRDELAKPGRSQAACARYIGLGSASQVNRIVKGERQIRDYEAEKIREYLSVTASGPNGQPARVAVVSVPVSAPVGVRFITVAGKIEAGAWREVFPDQAQEAPIAVPDLPIFTGEDVFALLVVGSSMNLKYREGGHVICRRFDGGPMPLGKDVVVERTDAAGKVETTLKELQLGPDGSYELWPRSNDPRYQEPIRFDPHEDREVRVIGRVIYRMEPVG